MFGSNSPSPRFLAQEVAHDRGQASARAMRAQDTKDKHNEMIDECALIIIADVNGFKELIVKCVTNHRLALAEQFWSFFNKGVISKLVELEHQVKNSENLTTLISVIEDSIKASKIDTHLYHAITKGIKSDIYKLNLHCLTTLNQIFRRIQTITTTSKSQKII